MTRQNNTNANSTYARNCNIDYFTLVFTSFIGSSIASAIGNFLVILIVIRNRKLRTTPNYFIASMSASDIFFPTAYLIAITISRYNERGYLSNEQANVLHAWAKFFVDVSFSVSTQTLVAICIHRFYAVVYPLKARLENLRVCTLTICFNWISATTLNVFELYYSIKTSREAGKKNRRGLTVTEGIILDVFNTSLVVVPFLVMLVLYSIIIVILRGKKIPGIANSSSLQTARRKKQNKRLSLMFFTIVIAFFISWGFLWVLVLIYRYSSGLHNCLVQEMLRHAQILPGIYTAINPLIYFVCSTNFRQGLKKHVPLLYTLFRCKDKEKQCKESRI